MTGREGEDVDGEATEAARGKPGPTSLLSALACALEAHVEAQRFPKEKQGYFSFLQASRIHIHFRVHRAWGGSRGPGRVHTAALKTCSQRG